MSQASDPRPFLSDSRTTSLKGSRKKAPVSPQVGVRWQFGAKGATPGPPSDDINGPEPLKEIFHHRIWKNPLVRHMLYRLRLSRYGACLAFVAAIATLNGVCTVLFLEAVFGSGIGTPTMGNHDLGSRQLLLGASQIKRWGSHSQTERSLPRFNPSDTREEWALARFFAPVKKAQAKFAKLLATTADSKWGLPNVMVSAKGSKWGLKNSSRSASLKDSLVKPLTKKSVLWSHSNKVKSVSSASILGNSNFNSSAKGLFLNSTSAHDAALRSGSSTPIHEWTSSNAEFLQELNSTWVVQKYSSEPGVYLLQQRSDFGCMLLLQDVCYLYLKGKSNLHSLNTGVWFARDFPGGNESKDLKAFAEQKSSPSQMARSPGLNRDLSKVDLSKDVCNFYPAAKLVEPPSSDSGDLSFLSHRGAAVYGRFIGRSDLAKYIDNSTGIGKTQHLRSPDSLPMGVIPRGAESSDVRFGINVVGFTETARHLTPERNSPSVASKDHNFTLFFPRDRTVQSEWVKSMGRLLLGSSTSAKGGQFTGKPICFQNAAFFLNARFTSQSADLLRLRGQRAALKAMARKSAAKKSGGGSKGFDLQGADFDELGEGVSLDKGMGGTASQITVYEGNQGMSNTKEVVRSIERLFPDMKVVLAHLAKMTLAEQISVMQRTALFIAFYSPTLSNIVFMPRGSAVLVLFPYKFYNDAYRHIALHSGLEYLEWENLHLKRTEYTDNCMTEKGFAKLTKHACLKQADCITCARDKSTTSVRIQELTDILTEAGPRLKYLKRPEKSLA